MPSAGSRKEGNDMKNPRMKPYLALLLAAVLALGLAGCNKDTGPAASDAPMDIADMGRGDALLYRQQFSMDDDMTPDGIGDVAALKSMSRGEITARWGDPDASKAGYYGDYQTDLYVYAAPDWSYGHIVKIDYKLDEFEADPGVAKPAWIRSDRLTGKKNADVPDLSSGLDLETAFKQPECWLVTWVNGKTVPDLEAMFGTANEKRDEPYGHAVFKLQSDDGMVHIFIVWLDGDGKAAYGDVDKTWADMDEKIFDDPLEPEESQNAGVGNYIPGIADDLVPESMRGTNPDAPEHDAVPSGDMG